ncbi:MAG TPA: beta-N-acetylhexosaminidase [Chthonomonadaceae bacterium]|nr:beta-N-acetylhexosaminidase [Chthonomonadaceae bacterium]
MQGIPEVHALSREEKIGQLLCLGWSEATQQDDARTVNAHARAVVEEMRAGSLVLMSRNVGAPEPLRALIAELNALAAIPLLVGVDQEGGWITRLGPPFTAFPGNMALGAIPGEQAEAYARRQAQAIAQELLAVGINWNFAPVVDVNNNPNNPIIGIRSFGEDLERVARLGAAAIDGTQQSGLLACAKHFPGHGDTSVDSHLALPTIPYGRERLESIELPPFRAAIAAGVGSIMTTHILFPALDAHNPATLSSAILNGLLRRDLGYGGVVITDCLEMHAISRTVGTARGAVEAIKAGADMALICHTLSTQREAWQALLKVVETGELPETRLDEAVGRVLAAKRRLAAGSPSTNAAPWKDPAHAALESEIAHAAITVIRNTGAIPIPPDASLLVISTHPAGPKLAHALERHRSTVPFLKIDKGFPAAQVEEALRAAGETAVIVTTAPLPPVEDAPALFLKSLIQACGDRLIVVGLREPYDLRRFPDIPNYLCAYGSRPCQLEALTDALCGIYQPAGRLPVTVPGK